MSSVTVVLIPESDGKLQLDLPIPAEWANKRVKVTAELQEETLHSELKPGLWVNLPGPFWIAEDFDAPLEDFREYME